MLATSKRLAPSYEGAKIQLQHALQGNRLYFRSASRPHLIGYSLLGWGIKEEESPSEYANLDLEIVLASSDVGDSESTRTLNLRVLSSLGDYLWTPRMVSKLWYGVYPDSVAVDKNSGAVYLLYLFSGELCFVEIGQLQGSDLEMVLFEVHDRDAYKILIEPDAMFTYIDGAEGLSFLQDNFYLEFNCPVPIMLPFGSAGLLETLN
jgi:hypothetical protein